MYDSQKHSAARDFEREILGLGWGQNFAGSVGLKTKWTKESRILEKIIVGKMYCEILGRKEESEARKDL